MFEGLKMKHDSVTSRFLSPSINKKLLLGCKLPSGFFFFFVFSCDHFLLCYQIPLDLPPGGARILADDLFGMLSSNWAPETAWGKDDVSETFTHKELLLSQQSTESGIKQFRSELRIITYFHRIRAVL